MKRIDGGNFLRPPDPDWRTAAANSGSLYPAVRAGFTILELLVTIGLISLLLSLVLPAIQSARSASRQMQCKNNLRQIGVAMTGYAVAMKRFPASGTFSAVGPEGYRSWVLELLPGLDQTSLYDRWDFNAAHDVPRNRAVGTLGIRVLICPEDITIVEGQGNLSYAANGGIGWTEPLDCPVSMHVRNTPPIFAQSFDLNGNGIVCAADPKLDGTPSDKDILFQMGMFFVENQPLNSGTNRHHTLDDILDGLSNTILVAESVRSGFDPAAPQVTGWGSPEPRRTCFFLSGYICQDFTCDAAGVDYRNANNRSAVPQSFESLNSALTQAEGQAPWPTSYHFGGINMLFGDGSVKFVSEAVDGAIYAAAVSPQGIRLTGPLRQSAGTIQD